MSIPGYVQKGMVRFQHPLPKRPQNSPYPFTPPKYGAKVQYAEGEDNSLLLDKEGKKMVQQVSGKFLWYSRAIDSTMLTALSTIASQQGEPTEETMNKVRWFLDYCASQEDAVITYRASNMVLAGHSDAGYLNEKKARSRAGGHWFLSNNDECPPDNGAILNISQIIKAVMSSAAEAELAALYINACEAVHMRNILEEMGHKQNRRPSKQTTAQQRVWSTTKFNQNVPRQWT